MMNNERNTRTRNEVDRLLSLAKLNKEDLLPATQMVYFAQENFYSNHYKLLQLDEHLCFMLSEGKNLFIRGEDGDDAVLCTDTCTYELLETETSNSLLILENLKFSEDLKNETECLSPRINVSGIFYNYLEPIPSKAHLSKVRNLLKESLYKGPEYEKYVDNNKLYSFQDILNKAQASELELKNILANMPIVSINGKIRLLDFEYHFRVLSLMLKLIDENSWLLDEIDYDETINSLSEIVPSEILRSLFEKYTVESKIIDGVQLYKYKEEDVCKFFAQVLLLHAGKFNLNEFLQAWQESVPEGMVPKENMLNGIAVVDRKANPPSIKAFSEEDLPEDIIERFKILFGIKEKWTIPEITPYIQPLTSAKQDVSAILAKYARGSTVNGIKYYSAKHSK